MSGWSPFVSSDFADTRHYWRNDGAGGGEVLTVQDVTPIIERNKAMANHNDGWSKSKEWKRAGSVPYTTLYKWIAEERLDPADPEFAQKMHKMVLRKLNDSDYRHLKSIPGRAG